MNVNVKKLGERILFDDANNWNVETLNSIATVSTDDNHPLFFDRCLKLVYRAIGREPSVSLRPSVPVKLKPFDTFTVWVYGNNEPVFGLKNPTPSTDISAEFRTSDGELWQTPVGKVQHLEWHMFYVHLPPELRMHAAKGGEFLGFTVTGGKNTTDRALYFSSLAVFTEKLPEYKWTPRPKRGVAVFPHAPQGFNIGEGRLPFGRTEATAFHRPRTAPQAEAASF